MVRRFDCRDHIWIPRPGRGHEAGSNDRFVLLEAGNDFERAQGSGRLVRVFARSDSLGAVNVRMIVIWNGSVVGDGGEGPWVQAVGNA